MVNIPIIFVCLWSALMFGVGYFIHWFVTPKVGFIHIEETEDGQYDRFTIEFFRDPTELYSLNEVMFKIKFRAVSEDNSPHDGNTLN